MKSLLLLLVAASFSLSASASCSPESITYISASLYLEIYTGCDSSESIYFTRKPRYTRDKNGVIYPKNDPNTEMKSYPIAEECTWKGSNEEDVIMKTQLNSKILSCHPKGRTPLAGATYKLKMTGKRYIKRGACGEKLEKPEIEEILQYVCVSGCKKKGVPARLNVPSSYCD